MTKFWRVHAGNAGRSKVRGYADDAGRELRGAGFRASRLRVGIPEWKVAGLPVAVGVERGVD